MLELSACTVDLATGRLRRASGQEARLSTAELRLLAYLASRPGADVSRDALLTELWGYSNLTLSRAVDATVRRLRNKIEQDSAHPRHLITVFGHGYRFEPLAREPEPIVEPAEPRALLRLGDRQVDLDRQEVWDGATSTPLTTSEVQLLRALLAAGGKVRSRAQLAAAMGHDSDRTSAPFSTVSRLRGKLEPDPDQPRFLLTVRNAGYRLELAPAPPTRTWSALARVAIWREHDLWVDEAEARVAAVQARLGRSASEASGAPAGDGWSFLFRDGREAVRWANAELQARPDDGTVLRIALLQGDVASWPDPVTGALACAGPAVRRAIELAWDAPPGTLVADRELLQAAGVEAEPLDDEVGLVHPPGGWRLSLPWAADSFVGRDPEVQRLRARLRAGARAVTLVGAPGVGKSRLALEVCAGIRQEGGVWFVSLAGARTDLAMIEAVARTLEISLSGDAEARFGSILARRGPMLLWLDDLDEGKPLDLVQRWLVQAPRLAVLATARGALGAPGETVHTVEPLSEEDGVRLFVDRCPASSRSTPPADLEAVRMLVRRLDGFPLAIELAAARTRSLSPRAILDRLGDPRLLADLTRSGRHRSMSAAIEVSWSLLEPAERATLTQCTVFQGSFDLEEAETVVDLGPDSPWVADVIGALMAHHLLELREDRYRLWGAVATDMRTRLSPQDRAAAEVRHGRLYAPSREELSRLETRPRAAQMKSLLGSVANVTVAVERALLRSEAEVAGAATLLLSALRSRTGQLAAMLPLVERVLEAGGGSRRVELLSMRGMLRTYLRLAGAEEDFLAAAASARERGQMGLMAVAEARLALCRGYVGPTPRDLLDSAVAHARSGGDSDALLSVLVVAGQSLTHEEPAVAGPLLEEALTMARARDDLTYEAVVTGVLAVQALQMGQLDVAARRCEAGLALHREAGSRRHEQMMLGRLGMVEAHRGNLVRAAQLFEQALPMAVETGMLLDEAYWRANLGEIYVRLGRPAEALPHAESAVQIASEGRVLGAEGQARAQLGMVLVALGREREGIAQIERGAALVIESGARKMAAQYLLTAPDTDERALERLERALALAQDPVTEAMVLCRRVKLLAGDEARAEWERAQQAVGKVGQGSEELERLFQEARAAIEGQ